MALIAVFMVVSLIGASQAWPAPLLNQQAEQHCGGPEARDVALICRSGAGEDGAGAGAQKWTASAPRSLAWSERASSQAAPERQLRRVWRPTVRVEAWSSARGPPAWA